MQKCREVFQRGNIALRDEAKKSKKTQITLNQKRKDEQLAEIQESRSILLEKWLSIERENGDSEWIRQVRKKQPKKIRKRRKIQMESINDTTKRREDDQKVQ